MMPHGAGAESGQSDAKRYALVIILACTLLYAGGLTGGFVWDDRMFFLDNDILPALKPWNLGSILLDPVTHWGDYAPLTDFLFVLEYNLFRLWTPGYHAVSLVLYALAGWAAWLLIHELYRGDDNTSGPLFVLAVFMAHPVHVEAVAYITGQKDLLYALFSLLAVVMFMRASEGNRMALATGALFYYLSFMSKGMAAASALFVPALWLIRYGWGGKRALIKPLGAWIGINVPALVILYLMVLRRAHVLDQIAGAPDRLVTGIKILGAHTMLVLRPWPLSFGYPFDPSGGFDANLAAGMAVIALLVLAIAHRPRSLACAGLAMYVIYLVPVLQVFISIPNAMIFDRYLFVAVLGAAIALERAASRLPALNAIERARVWAMAALVLVLGALTLSYVPRFSSDTASLGHSYRHFPGWDRAAFDYVYALIEEGSFDEALRLANSEPTFAEPPWVRDYFRGWVLLEQGRPADALLPLKAASMASVMGTYFPYPNIPLARAYAGTGNSIKAMQLLRPLMRFKHSHPLEYYKARKLLMELEAGHQP